MTEIDDLEEPRPLRVTERVVSTYQWDLWREATLRGSRRDEIVSIAFGVLAAMAAAAGGLELFDDQIARLSVLIYAPVVGAGVWSWTRSWLHKRQARRVGEEVRSLIVPALVRRISEQQMFRLLKFGGTGMADDSTLIRTTRQDSGVTLVAAEYDMSLYPDVFYGGDSGGGGG